MVLDIYQLDAFSNGPFTGNPAAVVPLKEWLPDHLMQQIALENNLSETAFFVRSKRQYDIRWFTPAIEVALCGHATLAAAQVIFTEMEIDASSLHFNCKSGPISVSRNQEQLTLDFPSDHLTQLVAQVEGLEEGLGYHTKEIWQGRHDLLCLIESHEELLNLRPNFSILQNLPGRGVIVTAEGSGEFDFVSRCFFPQSGINEDPATGSAHTSLTPFWSKKLNKTILSACQLSERKGFFHCVDDNDRTLISGQVILFLTGQIHL